MSRPERDSKDSDSRAKTPTRTRDESGEPDCPSDLTKPSWGHISRRTLREFSKDQCTDLLL